MELLVKPEMLTSYIYGPTFGNAETVSFYLLHNIYIYIYDISRLRVKSCHHWCFVYETCEAPSSLSGACEWNRYMYTTLAFLALLGAPYIYEISSLRVKIFLGCFETYRMCQSVWHGATVLLGCAMLSLVE